MPTMKIAARGESFKINQVSGNLFVCAEQNGGCCCGHTEKGRAIVNKDLYAQEWDDRKLRNKVHLTFVGCLGPCPIGNNAMLQIHGRSIWFKDLNDDRFIPMIYDYAEAMVRDGRVLPPTGELAEHVYERYLPAPDQEDLALGQGEAAEMDFDGIDPVCMMTVDPATAQFKSDYVGKTYYFCAASCKRSFDRDPAAYIGAKATHEQEAAAISVEPISVLQGAETMNTKTFVVPSISCDHCVRSIKNELSELAGVKSVQADANTKVVTVNWDDPATWEQIKAALTEIDYAPQELVMPG